ncbi:MAG: phosphoribosyltransferase [Sulfolobaceae archaeon]
MPKIPVRVVTWENIVEWSTSLAEIVGRNFLPDIIIPIARGGLVPARIVADRLGIIDMVCIKVEHWIQTAEAERVARIKYPYKLNLNGKKILIIDDIADTGDSLEVAKRFVEENFSPEEIKTATMQVIKPVTKFWPDFYARVEEEWAWFMYPWNYWEDEINLVKKILDESKKLLPINELERIYIESYGSKPPIPLDKIIEEMKRRKIL